MNDLTQNVTEYSLKDLEPIIKRGLTITIPFHCVEAFIKEYAPLEGEGVEVLPGM